MRSSRTENLLNAEERLASISFLASESLWGTMKLGLALLMFFAISFSDQILSAGVAALSTPKVSSLAASSSRTSARPFGMAGSSVSASNRERYCTAFMFKWR